MSHTLRPFLVAPKLEDLLVLKGLIEAGKLTPVIDRTYPLSETPLAIGHVGAGHARGKVAITVTGDGARTGGALFGGLWLATVLMVAFRVLYPRFS